MIVQTARGAVRGFVRDGVRAWRGIPYATAPRFAPPGPVAPWTGERDATKFGPVAVQSRDPRIAMMSGVTDKIAMGEDCLALNVMVADDERDAPRPVLVWIHGGAFVMGSGSTPLYDGRSFALRHGLVVVTLNYRLGLLGFHGGNHALLDQCAALAWVRDNIAAFGGDPGSVTVMGESAGAISIATLLAMPAADGLFHRAILQSGASPLTVAVGAEFPPIAHDATIDEILAVQASLAQAKGLSAFAPYIDGTSVPALPIEHLRTRVPLLLGTNRDEWTLFEVFLGAASVEPVKAPLRERLGARLDDILAVYGGNWLDVIGDIAFRLPVLRLAQQMPSYVYRFDWRSPAMNGRLGAAHAMELPLVWNRLDLPASQFLLGGAAVQPLADLMHDTWARFAKTGDPGWPQHHTARTTMLFDLPESRVVDDPDGDRRRAWDGLL